MPETKQIMTAQLQLAPVPAVLVSCADEQGKPNLITLAWVGIVCSEPPLVSISIRPSRYSYGLVKATGEFVVNVPASSQARLVDLCGVKSGREVDKFALCNFTAAPASKVKPPLVAECPVNLECKVRHSYMLGTHELFLGEVVAVQVSSSVLDDKGTIDWDKVNPLGFCAGEYRATGELLGTYGFSARD